MGLIDLASGASAWRGYVYYQDKRVRFYAKTGDYQYVGKVSGSGENEYSVAIDLEHPRSSKCSCPHASGKRLVCKHMVALYFAVFPKQAEQFYNDVIRAEQEEEERQERLENSLVKYVSKMKKSELQEALLQLLFDGPEWQYDCFLRDYIEEYRE